MANNFCPTCAEDCDYTLPAIDCSTCITISKGQISKLYIGIVGNPLTVAGGTDMVDRLDNTTLDDPTKIRVLCVKGALAASEVTTEELECNMDVVTRRAYTMELESNNLTDANYDFNRVLQACQGKYLIWYTFLDETKLYGGLSGIEASIAPSTQSTGSERTDRLQTTFTITWDASCDPERFANPVAGLVC